MRLVSFLVAEVVFVAGEVLLWDSDPSDVVPEKVIDVIDASSISRSGCCEDGEGSDERG